MDFPAKEFLREVGQTFQLGTKKSFAFIARTMEYVSGGGSGMLEFTCRNEQSSGVVDSLDVSILQGASGSNTRIKDLRTDKRGGFVGGIRRPGRT